MILQMCTNPLFDTGAGLACISLKSYKKISPESRPMKIHAVGIQANGASGGLLIPQGNYIITLEFEGAKILKQVQVYSNLQSDAILGFDVIENLGIPYL